MTHLQFRASGDAIIEMLGTHVKRNVYSDILKMTRTGILKPSNMKTILCVKDYNDCFFREEAEEAQRDNLETAKRNQTYIMLQLLAAMKTKRNLTHDMAKGYLAILSWRFFGKENISFLEDIGVLNAVFKHKIQEETL